MPTPAQDPVPPRRSLESLQKEAKQWLRRLRAGDAEAVARLARALERVPPAPTLRDLQHALARELGFPGWREVKAALERAAAGNLAALAP